MADETGADFRCGILDVLEGAALHKRHAEVHLDGRWRRIRVIDVVTDRGEDWVILADDERLAVGRIERARPA
ncbi:hypothetical protein [Guyparkeria halopsychrophila]|uniref:hypothetical protein n=1 Tax=Guyparkeria halopsychrophila TaxID=3139421 RepID=UPI0037C5DDBC